MRYLIVCFALLSAACAPARDASDTNDATPAAITIMTFNVENLFDTTHDEGKTDQTYLPLTAKQSQEHIDQCNEIPVDRWRDQCLYWNWSESVLDRKMQAIAGAILQVNDGRGPDVIALQEIENVSVLEALRTDYLAAANYLPAVLLEGRDERGIDVAFLSRLPLSGDPVLHDYDASGLADKSAADTRGILQASFELPDGSILTGFSVHFPAPYHPTEMRITAYEQLRALRESLPDDHYVFAAGDFNTTASEDAEKDLLGRFVRDQWTVLHELGCGENCLGTNYYSRGDSWSFLDMILWSPPERRGKNATWSVRKDSVQLANSGPEQVRDDGTPKRFEQADGSGVSDHWPLVATIELN